MNAPNRPILRYFGGKWKLAPWIISHFPEHRVYVEPFGGAASVLLRKPRSYAEIYNDLDGEIVNLFRICRDCGEELRKALYLTPYAREEFDLSFEPSDDPLEQARRTVARSYMGYGGNLTRPNRDQTPQRTGFRTYSGTGRGAVPAQDWMNYPEALPAIIERLRGVFIEHRDALDVMRAHDGPETLHYVDPPYPHSVRRADRGGSIRGYRHEMTDEEHRALAEFLRGGYAGTWLSRVTIVRCTVSCTRIGGWRKNGRSRMGPGSGKSVCGYPPMCRRGSGSCSRARR